MQHLPAGFIPNEWNQTLGSFRRLVQQLANMQRMLAECSEVTSDNSDIEFVREQLQNEVDTLQFMTSDAETRWKPVGVAVASAAGQLHLNRPADDVAWCSALIGAAWHFHNGLQRELSGDKAETCVQRLPLHLGRIPNDIGAWQNRITAELRAGTLCKADTVEHVEQPKIILVKDQAIHDVHAAVQSANGTETIKDICARIAERDGLKPESLRTQYNRWRRDEGLNTR